MGAQPIPEKDMTMVESGQKFGKYTLLERLASGGMAEIYKAGVEGADGRQRLVAIKRLHDQYSQDREFATMLVDEAKLAVQLQHPNIGGVFDLECLDGQYFIVMEYIDGLDCKQIGEHLQEGRRRLPAEAAVTIGAEVASALAYAHTKKGPDGRSLQIVHRDVSPQNIMVSLQGEIKLVDFGIAKARMRAQHTRAGVIKGKFYYMSPEQAHGSQLDGRSDVYGLAMVLYELMVGGHPFDRVSDGELLGAVKRAAYPPVREAIPGIDEGLARIMEKGLARQREDRYASAQAFEAALRGYGDRRGQYGRADLARLVGQLREGVMEPSGLAMMGSEVFTVSEHSVIFDAGDRPYESDPSQLSEDGPGVGEGLETSPGKGSDEGGSGGGKTVAIAAAAVAALLSLAVIWWWSPWVGEDIPEAGLAITSSPSGATVYFEEIRIGATPMEWSDVEPGERYVLRLEHEGYEAHELSLEVGQEATGHYVEMIPLLGSLDVVAQGEGAEIWWDDEKRGRDQAEMEGLFRGEEYVLEAVWPPEEEDEDEEDGEEEAEEGEDDDEPREARRQEVVIEWQESEARHQRVVFEGPEQEAKIEIPEQEAAGEDDGNDEASGRGGALDRSR